MGSFSRLTITEPARAYATTRGGDARKLSLVKGWIRPSKFLFPESTLDPTRSFDVTASVISGFSGPELPIQVVQPYPTTLNPSDSRSSKRPVFLRYSVTTFEPGARLVLTQGCDVRPNSCAFLAKSPAAIITTGFDVLVQLVIAAIKTEPLDNSPVFTSLPFMSFLLALGT